MKIYRSEQFISAESSIHIFKSNVKQGEPSHTHDFIEIVYILSGTMTHVIDGVSYDVMRGDILFMNYGCAHEIIPNSDERSSYINILFSPESISENISPTNAFSLLALASFNTMRNDADCGKLSFADSEKRAIENIVLNMLSECKEKKQGWEGIVENYLNILLKQMLRKSNAMMEYKEIDNMWRELLGYIEENLESKLSLYTLAQKCFYNPSYFSRIFKEKFGMSLMEYITQKRLEHAVELLEASSLSVEQIAQKVGFSDRNSFHHAFSRSYGLTPQQFRKSNQK